MSIIRTEFFTCILFSAFRQRALLAGLFIAGGLIGFFAWTGKVDITDTLEQGLAQLNGSLLLILALTIFWSNAKSRWQATLPYFGYVLAGSRDLPAVYQVFFPLALAYTLWIIAQAVFIALPWCNVVASK